MAISRVAGQMLRDILERDGVDISFANTNIGINTVSPTAELDVIGNIVANNITTTGNVKPSANLTYDLGATDKFWLNVYANTASVAGNVIGGNITTVGIVQANNLSATSNISGGNLSVTELLSTANITASGNVLGNLNVSGNIAGGNLLTVGVVSTTGNIVGNYVIANAAIISNVNIGNLVSNGNLIVNSLTSNTFVSATGNVIGGNIVSANYTSTGNITISTASNGNITLDPNGSGITVLSGTDGVVIPVGTTGERPGSPSQGTLRFNSTTNQLEIWDGSEWDAMGSQAVITNQQIIPDGSADTYTLDQQATADGILVSMNGVSQTPGVDYTVSGDQITFTTIPLTTDVVQVRFIASVATISGLTNSTANSSVTVTNTPSINFEVNSTVIAQFDENEILDISACHSLQLPTYTVSEATSLTNVTTGQLIYVSNGDSGNPCLAVYSGGTFKRVALGSTIST
jgi:hypothetical protein